MRATAILCVTVVITAGEPEVMVYRVKGGRMTILALKPISEIDA